MARTQAVPRRFTVPSAEPKCAGSADRSVALETTLANAATLRRRFGITRVGDLTHLDRTGIPVACAVVPTANLITTFNGKGASRGAAIASAVMEAVERMAAERPALETHRREVRDACTFLDLDAYGLLPEARDATAECAWGTNLIDGAMVPVPMQLVQCPWRRERLFPRTTSNGLAAGNTRLEALYHALLELVERHVWSLAYVRCELVPRFYRRTRDAAAENALAMPTGDPAIDGLAERVERAGLALQVMMLDESGLPPVAVATLVEPRSDPPMAHQGLGCSLSPRHAVVRAITEAVQSRVVDIAAARDDLLRAHDPPRETGEHARRVAALPAERWFFGLPTSCVELGALRDCSSDDLARDVRCLLAQIDRAGLGPVVAFDISPAGVPAAVVRVVAPRFETASLDGRLRAKARALFNPFSIARAAHSHQASANRSRKRAI